MLRSRPAAPAHRHDHPRQLLAPTRPASPAATARRRVHLRQRRKIVGSAEPAATSSLETRKRTSVSRATGRSERIKGNASTDADLLAAEVHGVVIDGAPGNTIGGPGGRITSSVATTAASESSDRMPDNVISGNFIGELLGSVEMGNTRQGVYIQNSGPNLIGGPTGDDGNHIAFNGGAGVAINATPAVSSRKSILSNSIHSNAGLGIDLGDNGVTLNDNKDPDTGANMLQNYPVLQSAEEDSGQTIIRHPGSRTPLQKLFAIRVRLQRPRGKVFLGDVIIPTTDIDGNAVFTDVRSGSAASTSATATDPDGNTGFACVFVMAGHAADQGDIDCMNGLTATDGLGT
jgi:hypothetical protein